MGHDTAVILIASVSSADAWDLGLALKPTGATVLRVEGADEAARCLDGRERAGLVVLVIDAGLLEMAHDPQWRIFRKRHPALRTIVRRLLSRPRSHPKAELPTVDIHPDDMEGLREAVGLPQEVRLPPACRGDRRSQVV